MNQHASTTEHAADPSIDGLKASIHRRLLDSIDLTQARKLPREQLRTECAARVESLLKAEGKPLSSGEKETLITQVLDEIFGLGPLEEILRDPDISDILINGPRQIYCEKKGRLEVSHVTFRDNEHLLQVIERIAAGVGRRVDESSPMLDARLKDGSRVNAIIPPLALDGCSVSIRRFGRIPFDIDKLIEVGAATPEMMTFLRIGRASCRERVSFTV